MKGTAVDALVYPQWLIEHRGATNIVLVEINTENTSAYEKQHIPDALGWEWKRMLWDSSSREFPSPDEFARRMAQNGIGNNTTVVFYGDPIEFGFYGWWVLKYCGHDDVRMLDGSKTRWAKEGLPFTSERTQPTPTIYTPRARREGYRILRDEVLRELGDQQTVILDNRSDEEFQGLTNNLPGKTDFGAERYGRIPGAVHLNFTQFLEPDGSFIDKRRIREKAEAVGATADKALICYCRRSHRAALVSFAFIELLGYSNVRNYDGSWSEWGTAVGMPIENPGNP